MGQHGPTYQKKMSWVCRYCICITKPSGKRLHSYRRSPFFTGKTHYKWPCSKAMLYYQRVIIVRISKHSDLTRSKSLQQIKGLTPVVLSRPCQLVKLLRIADAADGGYPVAQQSRDLYDKNRNLDVPWNDGQEFTGHIYPKIILNSWRSENMS